jgi:hypothetical protein
MNGLQEKFQILAPPEKEEVDSWVTAGSVRRVGEAGFLHESNTEATGPTGPKFNQLPPGMEINNQLRDRIHAMPLCVAGESDVSADTNAHSFKHGYTRRDMKGADDQYTGEHVDFFYSEVVDENGKEGFAERNNLLDRL